MNTKVWSGNLREGDPRGRHRHIWEDNIRMDLTQIAWDGVGWIRLVQDRDPKGAVVKTVMNLRVL
jgi:hypothetical protein